MIRIAIAAALGAAVCGPAFAAPVATQANPGIQSEIQQVAYRRCWWQHGERHCRWVRNGNRIYRYGAGSPDDYRVGTAEWYRAMERDGRLNRPGWGR
jgi:hypothetical protein